MARRVGWGARPIGEETIMAAVYVDLGGIGSKWPTACKTALAHLNQLFTQNSIGVSLASAKVDPELRFGPTP